MTSLTAATWTPSADYLDRSRLVEFCAAVGVSGRAGLLHAQPSHADDGAWRSPRSASTPRATKDA